MVLVLATTSAALIVFLAGLIRRRRELGGSGLSAGLLVAMLAAGAVFVPGLSGRAHAATRATSVQATCSPLAVNPTWRAYVTLCGSSSELRITNKSLALLVITAPPGSFLTVAEEESPVPGFATELSALSLSTLPSSGGGRYLPAGATATVASLGGAPVTPSSVTASFVPAGSVRQYLVGLASRYAEKRVSTPPLRLARSANECVSEAGQLYTDLFGREGSRRTVESAWISGALMGRSCKSFAGELREVSAEKPPPTMFLNEFKLAGKEISSAAIDDAFKTLRNVARAVA
jgi:hypothetical protein